MNEREKLAIAKRRVEAITGFYVHLSAFGLIMAILLAINLFVSQGWWVQWPLLGWSAGLVGHGLIVFGGTPDFITQWKLRKIDEIRQKL